MRCMGWGGRRGRPDGRSRLVRPSYGSRSPRDGNPHHNAQMAVDQPRFCIKDGFADGAITFEEGIPDEVSRS